MMDIKAVMANRKGNGDLATYNAMVEQEKRISELSSDIKALSTAVVRAQAILDNDPCRTRVEKAHTELNDVHYIAVNWTPDPPSC